MVRRTNHNKGGRRMAHVDRDGERKQEHLGDTAKVTGSILSAYLAWAGQRWDDAADRLRGHVDGDTAALLGTQVPENRRVLFRHLIALAKAIAAAEGGDPDVVYHALGQHSAALNMAGAYKRFEPDAPHHFFDHMDHLHHTFQNFGTSDYTRTGERAGRIRLQGYHEYSPVYCQSALGYYEEVLKMLRAPGPVNVAETECQCAGEPACVFELSW
jgi:hypothetical protein